MKEAQKFRHTALSAFLLLCILLALLVSTTKANAAPKILKVAIIDSGFGFDAEQNKGLFKICKTGSYDFINDAPLVGDDQIGHGTAVTQLVNKHAQTRNLCYLIYKVFGADGSGDNNDINKALVAAHRNKAAVINMSLGSVVHSLKTKSLLRTITRQGVKVFVAAGNEKKNLNITCNTYPVCYKGINSNMVVVGAHDNDYDVSKYSNRGAFITVYKYGRTRFGARGTSFAAPRAAGDYIKSLEMDGK